MTLLKYGSYEAIFVLLGNLVYDEGLYFLGPDVYVYNEFIETVSAILIGPAMCLNRKSLILPQGQALIWSTFFINLTLLRTR